jgi:hypothetical protein
MAKKNSRLHRTHYEALPNPIQFPNMDSYYELYRMSLLMASAPNEPNVPTTSAIANNPIMVPYSDQDARIIELARKLGGFAPEKHMAPGKSSEMPDTNTTSPFNTQANTRKSK